LGGYAFYTAERLGCSQLVVVRKAATGETFCGKLVPKEKLSEFLQLEGSAQKILRANPHPNILQPVAIVDGGDVSGVVFPAVGEDLHTFVRNKKGLKERDARPIFKALVSAVLHCHNHRIVLRDIRLGKVFFRNHSRTEVVIADLDGAQVVSHASPFLFDRKGSPAFVSPEVVVSPAYDGAAADMWALGVVLYILLTGTYPFQDSHPATLFQKIQQGHSAVYFPSSMSEAVRDIMRSLLLKEAHLRLTARALHQDLWLRDAEATHEPASPAAAEPMCTPAAAISPAAAAVECSNRKRRYGSCDPDSRPDKRPRDEDFAIDTTLHEQ